MANKSDQCNQLADEEYVMMKFCSKPNNMTKAQFLHLFGSIYEHSPWVAETIWQEGVTDADESIVHLGDRMRVIVDNSGHEQQMTLLCAHPELAGKLAIDGGLTAESTSEQSSAGLDRCSPDEFTAFQELNTAYGGAFGHPFIIAVRGLTRADILAAFQRRIKNDAVTEFAAALAEVHKIAHLRLEAMAGDA